MRLLGINPTESVVIPQSLVLRSIVLDLILINVTVPEQDPLTAAQCLSNMRTTK